MLNRRFLHLFLLVGSLCPLFLKGQQTDWALPKHLFSASFGVADQTKFAKDYIPSLNSGSVAYTYNFARHWWVGAEWQTGFTRFDWQPQQIEMLNSSTKSITELPVFYKKGSLYSYDPTLIVSDAAVVKLPKNGFYEYRNFALSGGYTMLTPRNALRFGLGISKNRIRIREIERPYGINTIPYLVEYTNTDWAVNAALQYDFFLTPQYSVGIRLTSIANLMDEYAQHYSAMFSIGYALQKRQKQKPRA